MAAHKKDVRRWGWFAAALVCVAAVACCIIAGTGRISFGFLRGAKLVAVQDAKNPRLTSDTKTRAYYFTLRGDWRSVYAGARAELDTALERPRDSDSADVRELVIPRMEGGRISPLYPPDKIVLVSPGRVAVRDKSRLVRERSDEPWTTVEVLEFRRDSAIDRLADWIRGAVQI